MKPSPVFVFSCAAALCACLSLPSLAGDSLLLAHALVEAHAASPDLEAAQARIEAATLVAANARDQRLPRLDLVARALGSDDPAAVFALELQQGRFSLQDFAASDPGSASFTDDWMIGAQLSMPLYTGGRLASARRGAQLGVDGARIAGSGLELEIDSRVVENWVGVARATAAQASLEARRSSLESLHERLGELRKQGLALDADLLEVSAHLAALEAGQAELGAAQIRARAMLQALLTRPVNESIELESTNVFSLPSDADLFERLAARPDLRGAELSRRQAEIELQASQAERRPMVGVVAGVSSHDHQIFAGNLSGTNATVAIEGRWRMPDRRERAADRTAELRGEAAAHDLESRRLQARAELESALAARRAADTAQRAAAAGQAAASEHLRVRQARFDAGLLTVSQLLDAEALIAAAEARTIDAKAARLLAEARIALVAGITLTEVTTPEVR